ncbi:growth hormone-regulated TBC protein 1-A [Nothobranchius furzeri]|uniref:Growth hormone-regulated TBC protein 1 n=4 Tax=Nothobranchius TaxID=28779 RepID=A0A9D2Y7F1_NOTFU|nr:growth hormone-regulated TBC protein 1-A [Nothobranchius furzeri]KAF7215594.1 growth hormone-regulated TBC protein 1-A-like [Nothobranchius furzeri]
MEGETKAGAETEGGQSDRIDPYGFERHQDFEQYNQMMNEYVAVLNRRSKRWSKLLRVKPNVEKNLTVKRYVRKGVPNEHRARIWMAASGAQEQLESKPGYYQSLLEMEHDAKLKETIQTDLHRTFPDNILFQSRADAGLQTALYNVLLAYGHHNQTVGYCQGMNFIAGYLIIITKDEEKSFWLMDALLDKILPDYYSTHMLGLKVDQEVLGELVKTKAPAVGQLMAQYPGIWTLVVSRWFICLYIDILPIETVLRVWDCLFYEGSKVLFRVALTLVLHHHMEILRARSLPDVCMCFKEITSGAFTLDCHTFMQKIFSEPGSLSMTTIEKLREKYRQQILEESQNK